MVLLCTNVPDLPPGLPELHNVGNDRSVVYCGRLLFTEPAAEVPAEESFHSEHVCPGTGMGFSKCSRQHSI